MSFGAVLVHILDSCTFPPVGDVAYGTVTGAVNKKAAKEQVAGVAYERLCTSLPYLGTAWTHCSTVSEDPTSAKERFLPIFSDHLRSYGFVGVINRTIVRGGPDHQPQWTTVYTCRKCLISSCVLLLTALANREWRGVCPRYFSDQGWLRGKCRCRGS